MKKPFIFLVLAGVIGLLFDVLFYKTHVLGLNVLIFEAAIVGGAYLLAHLNKVSLTQRVHISAVFSILLALPFFFSTSGVGHAVAGTMLFFTNAVFITYILGDEATMRDPITLFFRMFAIAPIKSLFGLQLLSHVSLPKTLPKNTLSIAVGVLITLPLLAIFLALFASADPVFSAHLKDITDGIIKILHLENLPDLYAQGILILFTSIAAFMVYAAAFSERTDFAKQATEHKRYARIESIVVLSALAVLFGLFLLSQSATMFGGEAAVQNLNMTYAEYARTGFAQLVAVAALTATIILTLRGLHGENEGKTHLTLHGILIGETLLVLASAYLRLNLYISATSYTPLRLLVLTAIVTFAVLFIMLLVHVVTKEAQEKFMQRAMVVIAIGAVLFSMSWPDALTAKLNLARAEDGEAMDFDLMGSLSAEAEPYIREAITKYARNEITAEHETAEVPLIFAAKLCDQRSYNYHRVEKTTEYGDSYTIHDYSYEFTRYPERNWKTFNIVAWRNAPINEDTRQIAEELQLSINKDDADGYYLYNCLEAPDGDNYEYTGNEDSIEYNPSEAYPVIVTPVID